MKPICVPCQRFFRCKKNDFPFIEAMTTPGEGYPQPGTSEPERWKPYKLWFGDKWECEGCGAVIVVGVAKVPVAEHYQIDFTSKVEHYGAELQVNDC